ncbi:MAG TPA: metal ABC transporter ATP-binding protein [Methylomirabilota bacterium]|nr:metal ABC transporter ATP-binding protein [Methylomirabilota bacterium]
MSAPILTVSKLSVGYQQRAVLQDVSFDLERGSYTFILGANGSGKSTLLKTLAGVLKPLSGNIASAPDSVRIGYVPQRHSIDPLFLLTSLDVVLMGAAAHLAAGAPLPKSHRARAEELLRQAAGDVADREFARLSGGQQQRVLIARGLMTNPDLLLLDEPTAGVDATAAIGILEWLQEMNASGLTIVLVTHHLSEIRRFASSMIWVSRGGARKGSVDELQTPGKLEELLLG